MMRALRRRLIAAGVVATVVVTTAGVIVAEHQRRALPPAQEQPAAVRTTPVERRDFREVYRASGPLAARARVVLRAEVGGRVTEILADADDEVRAGQELIRLDDERLRLARAEAQALKEQRQAEALLARTRHGRVERLREGGQAAQEDLDLARRELAVAEALLRQMEGRTAALDRDLADCLPRAPFAGRVTRRLVEVGDLLAPGAPVLELMDLSELKLRLSVPAAVLGALQVGQPAAIVVQGRPALARIARLSHAAAEGALRFELELSLPNPDATLWHGLVAEAELLIAEAPQALVVPRSAVQEGESEGGGDHVWLVRDGRAVKTPVAIRLRGQEELAVAGELAAGVRVVIEGGALLVDGAAVKDVGP